MTVGQLLASISARELTEWLVFYEIEADEARKQQDGGRTSGRH